MTDIAGVDRTSYGSIREGGLHFTSLPMRLFQKGNRMFWNPADIDMSREAEDWANLSDDEREMALRLAALFIAGEEAVTKDIQPFMGAMSREGRLEDEMYLTQFAFEEAKHVEAWRRWLDAVGAREDLNSWVDDNEGYRIIFHDILPNSLARLHTDSSPAAQVRAAVVYNQVVEGVLAMTGYHSWRRTAEDQGILPGVVEVVRLIGKDERRHMAWGTYTCRRHVAADPANWEVVQKTLDELLEPALSIIDATYKPYEDTGRDIPFGLAKEELQGYATNQFASRLGVIEAAKGRSLAEIEGVEEEELEDRLEGQDLEAGSVVG